MLINDMILKAMREKYMSYGELSKLTGLSKTTVYKYVTGNTRKIPVDNLNKIAKALNIDVMELFYADIDKNKVAFPHVLTMDKGQVDKLSVAFVDVLERLGTMYKEGLLTAEEFQLAKDRILKENMI